MKNKPKKRAITKTRSRLKKRATRKGSLARKTVRATRPVPKRRAERRLTRKARVVIARITDWSYSRILGLFGSNGCSVPNCRYHNPGAQPPDIYYCDQPPHSSPRVRNADGMARIVKAKNGGRVDVVGWANRPRWQGIVYFEGGPDLSDATGHIDLWNGTAGVHGTYPSAEVVWFWQLAR
jgi:Type VI secretion system (T6SS), amidase effector protein 4